ncbi:MAG: glucuronate isomerase [Bacillus subtilis]|nr:glucuronate isomerase [Bacillus subtilis]
MRANGVDESFITGKKPDYAKFLEWAKTVPNLLGNPLYHWTHMELKHFFHIDQLLSPSTAHSIYEEVNRQLPEKTAPQADSILERRSRLHDRRSRRFA